MAGYTYVIYIMNMPLIVFQTSIGPEVRENQKTPPKALYHTCKEMGSNTNYEHADSLLHILHLPMYK
jgi:hypothetical protein